MTLKALTAGSRKKMCGYAAAIISWITIIELFERELEKAIGSGRLYHLTGHLMVPLGCVVIIYVMMRANLRDLEVSENRLKTVINCSPFPIITLSTEGLVRSWNPAAEAVFGWKEHEVLGRVIPTVPPEKAQDFRNMLAGIVAGETQIISREVTRRRRDGSSVKLSVSLVRLVDKEGNLTGIVSIMEDISERKQHENALRESEKKYRELFEQMLNGLAVCEIICDVNGRPVDYRIVEVNSGFSSITGLSPEEVIGRTARELFPYDDRSWLEMYARVALTGESVHVEKYSTHLKRDLEIQVYSPVHGRFAAVFTDITERKKATLQLADLQRRQQAMLDNIPDLVWMKDVESRFVIVNEAFGRACKRDPAELVGLTDLDVWPEEHARLYRHDDQLVIRSCRRHRTEEPLADSTRGDIWIETIKMPVVGESGEVIGTTGIARDITDRKEAEAERKQYEEQLARLAGEISLAEDRERRRIAHELHDQVGQTLAFGKMKISDLLRRCEGDEAVLALEIRSVIERCIFDIRSLTFQLSPPLLFEVGVEAAVEDLAERFQRQYGLRIVVTGASGLVPLSEEVRVAVFRAVRELLVNAAKHACAEEVRITFEEEAGRFFVKVCDDGVGADLPELECRPDGGGFGLFNIRERIGSLGGRFSVSTAPGAGFAAVVEVPAALLQRPGVSL